MRRFPGHVTKDFKANSSYFHADSLERDVPPKSTAATGKLALEFFDPDIIKRDPQ